MKDITNTRMIGPIGTGARIAAGLFVIAVVLADGVDQQDLSLGLIVIPLLVTLGHAWLIRDHPGALRGVDQFGACATALIVAPFLIIPYTSDATWLWLGVSTLLAAARGHAGCEVLAISNWLLRKEDQVGCMIFTPIDQAESLWKTGRLNHPGQVSPEGQSRH